MDEEIRLLNILAGRQVASNQMLLTVLSILTRMSGETGPALLDEVIDALESHLNEMKGNLPSQSPRVQETRSYLLEGVNDTLETLKVVRRNWD